MKQRSRSVVLVFSLGAGLVLALGLLFAQTRARAQQRHDLWLSYVHGPLTLYVQGSQEGASALLARPSKARRRALGDAAQDLRQAWVLDGDMKPDLDADEVLDALAQAVQWFESSEQLAEDWPKLEMRRPDEIAAAAVAAESIRSQMSILVAQQWTRLAQDQSLAWTPLERAQSEALVLALAQPLPQKALRPGRRAKKRLIYNKKRRS